MAFNPMMPIIIFLNLDEYDLNLESIVTKIQNSLLKMNGKKTTDTCKLFELAAYRYRD